MSLSKLDSARAASLAAEIPAMSGRELAALMVGQHKARNVRNDADITDSAIKMYLMALAGQGEIPLLQAGGYTASLVTRRGSVRPNYKKAMADYAIYLETDILTLEGQYLERGPDTTALSFK